MRVWKNSKNWFFSVTYLFTSEKNAISYSSVNSGIVKFTLEMKKAPPVPSNTQTHTQTHIWAPSSSKILYPSINKSKKNLVLIHLFLFEHSFTLTLFLILPDLGDVTWTCFLTSLDSLSSFKKYMWPETFERLIKIYKKSKNKTSNLLPFFKHFNIFFRIDPLCVYIWFALDFY